MQQLQGLDSPQVSQPNGRVSFTQEPAAELAGTLPVTNEQNAIPAEGPYPPDLDQQTGAEADPAGIPGTTPAQAAEVSQAPESQAASSSQLPASAGTEPAADNPPATASPRGLQASIIAAEEAKAAEESKKLAENTENASGMAEALPAEVEADVPAADEPAPAPPSLPVHAWVLVLKGKHEVNNLALPFGYSFF